MPLDWICILYVLTELQIPENICIKDVKSSSNQVEVECKCTTMLWSSFSHAYKSDHLTYTDTGSDGHKSLYDPNLLKAATAPLEERAVIRQGLAE